MWNNKLCLGVSEQFKLPVAEQIKLFHDIGFDAFFTGWNYGANVGEWKKYADSLGIEYQSIHAPFSNSAKMWEDESKAASAVKELIDCLHCCSENKVPIMIAHTFIGFENHTPTESGIINFGKVINEAERLGVKIAFENTEGEEYLAALMEKFSDNDAVGFCWDTGHEMCYNHSQDMLKMYGKKLICTHLNDNLGIRDYSGKITYIDDLHLLPFDGIADWANIAARLDREKYNGILTFELNIKSKPGRHENDVYQKLDIKDYFTEVYKRACRVATLRAKQTCFDSFDHIKH